MDLHRTLYQTRGAVTAVADALRISDAAVSQWKRRGIPENRRADVERVLVQLLADGGPVAQPQDAAP